MGVREAPFRELSFNTQTTDFTVVGIGDMAGDVFGNGMLMSPHIRLVAAFNHMHIFIDPNPDSERSFQERMRLFKLPRSSWTDYDESLISEGGGVFLRSAKSIRISPEIQKALGVSKDHLVPNDLLRAILKAPVDLLWNGGIGTFVKAENEVNTDAGDRTNDAIRVNGSELQCKVAAEGGNLGFTQRGRIEYSLSGGLMNTDFIDNSAGVDCSDKEVNIKILLNGVVKAGDLTEKQRNKLLADMTDEVAALVLRNNHNQTRAISLAAYEAYKHVDLYARYINEQERKGYLDRDLEFLPDEKQLTARKAAGKGLTRPGISVLLAYSKNILKQDIISSAIPDDPYLAGTAETAFPKRLSERYRDEINNHSLRREIIATQISSNLINDMGVTFVQRLQEETGANPPGIVKAYTIAKQVFDLDGYWAKLESLSYDVKTEVQVSMMIEALRLVRRATRWFLRNRRVNLDVASNIAHFTSGVAELFEKLPRILTGEEREVMKQSRKKFIAGGVPSSIATEFAGCHAMFSSLDLIETATEHGIPVRDFAAFYYMISEELELGWFRRQITGHQVESHWDALARAALIDDLDSQQSQLTLSILQQKTKIKGRAERLQYWLDHHQTGIARWRSVLNELRGSGFVGFTTYAVVVRELFDLSQWSLMTEEDKQLHQ